MNAHVRSSTVPFNTASRMCRGVASDARSPRQSPVVVMNRHRGWAYLAGENFARGDGNESDGGDGLWTAGRTSAEGGGEAGPEARRGARAGTRDDGECGRQPDAQLQGAGGGVA